MEKLHYKFVGSEKEDWSLLSNVVAISKDTGNQSDAVATIELHGGYGPMSFAVSWWQPKEDGKPSALSFIWVLDAEKGFDIGINPLHIVTVEPTDEGLPTAGALIHVKKGIVYHVREDEAQVNAQVQQMRVRA